MAQIASNSFELGKVAPDFNLFDTVSGSFKDFQSLKGEQGTVIVFICNHCPFVIHINDTLVRLAHDYLKKGFGFIAISSNDVEKYPQDGPDHMKILAKKMNFPFPYLFDESQEVAKAYNASCTPDWYVFDHHQKAVYHGQLDDSRPGNDIQPTGKDIKDVLDALLLKKSVNPIQLPSIGCSIKWK
jgi:peroxiredoxin